MLLNLESGAYAFTGDPDEGTLTIGRENDCNFIVKEDGVSRHHCKLWFEEGRWLVEDTESKHGTLVNNKQIHKPAPLKSGDVLRVASVNFMVSLHATNEAKDIGRALAGGAREKLKLLDKNAAPAKPTRVMRKPAKQKPVVEEEEEQTAPATDAPPPEANVDDPTEPEAETEAKAETDAPAEPSAESEEAAEEKAAKPTAAKLRPGAKGATKVLKKGGVGAKPSKDKKDAPKKGGGGALKIVIAVVIFVAAGAGAYFGLGMNAEKPPESKTGAESKKNDTPETPAIPAKPDAEAPKEPSKEESKEEPKAQ